MSLESLRKSKTKDIDYDQLISEIPVVDHGRQLGTLNRRSALDKPYHSGKTDLYVYDKQSFLAREASEERKDYCDILSRYPSYTIFKLPLNVICAERYIDATKKYEAQFYHEINQLVSHQCRAIDAAYFVRTMAYTSIWPPYHNERELIDTSKTFYPLSQQENKRMRQIMDNEVI